MSKHRHTERIVCPKCRKTQRATVIHSTPYYIYIHRCIECKYVIMESEWQKIDADRLIKKLKALTTRNSQGFNPKSTKL